MYNPSSCFKVCVNDLTDYGFAGDALLLELYNKLKLIYPTLDQMIKHHANFYRYKQTVADYGEHNILFLLKSLELDHVLKFKPGTVFGYDMDISMI